MLNNTGFDLWADGYDKSVGLSDENDRYPFAGYRAMMNALYQRVLAQSGRDVLDIGFGTGILTSRLYEQGCQIYNTHKKEVRGKLRRCGTWSGWGRRTGRSPS